MATFKMIELTRDMFRKIGKKMCLGDTIHKTIPTIALIMA